MKIGLIGLPVVGKTSLFNLLTGSDIEIAGFSTGKISANIGIAKVPDERIDFISQLNKPLKTIYATIEVVDVPGLSRGASAGKGAGNQFLDHVRNSDVLVHVVRAFEDESIAHEEGSISPIRDIETINLELLLADLGVIENRIERIKGEKKQSKEGLEEIQVLEKCKEGLENGLLIHSLDLSDHEKEILKSYSFLSERPMIIAVNIDEDQLMEGTYPDKEEVEKYSQESKSPIIEISAKTELEISQLEEEDRATFMEELGISESGIDKLSKTAYDYLGLISFITAGEKEVRAWPIRKGTLAKYAAGKIHSDIEKGFIRAEVCAYADLKEHGSMLKAREQGLVTLEGKEYVVNDGDIINFRFNV